MTVPNTIVTRTYVGNGSATNFPTDLQVFTASQVKVYLRDADGDTLQTQGTQYTVSGAPGQVTIEFTSAPSDTVVVERVVNPVQLLDLENSQAFYPETVEDALDLLTMGVQEALNGVARALRLPPGEEFASLLPQISQRLNGLLGFDGSGEPVVYDLLDPTTYARLDRENTFTEDQTFLGDVDVGGNLDVDGTVTFVEDGVDVDLATFKSEVDDNLPTSSPPADKVWKTDASGVPGWRDDAVAETSMETTTITQTLDLHEDVTRAIPSLADSDRFFVSDESAAGDPNSYATALQMDTYIGTKRSALFGRVPTANPGNNLVWGTDSSGNTDWRVAATNFNLHNDVTTELASFGDQDRLLLSDEDVGGDPNRYATLVNLRNHIRSKFDIRYLQEIADDSVTLAKMAHGTAGDVIYFDSTGAPQRLAKGQNGQVLGLVNGVPAWIDSSNKVNTTLVKVSSTIDVPELAADAEYTVFSASITPNFANSIIEIKVLSPILGPTSGVTPSTLCYCFVRGSVDVYRQDIQSTERPFNVTIHDRPNSTSAVTYTYKIVNNTSAARTPADVYQGTEMRLTEIEIK